MTNGRNSTQINSKNGEISIKAQDSLKSIDIISKKQNYGSEKSK